MNSTLRLLILFLTSSALSFSAQSQQPCTLCGTTASEWIAGITIDGNSSLLDIPGGGFGGCVDQIFIDGFVAILKKGVSHSFSLTPGFSGAAQSEYWKIWLDLNHDGDFNDLDDLVYASGSGSTTTVSGSFFIPLSVATGAAAIRVAMRRGSPPPDCGNYNNGQELTYSSAYIDECDISFYDACAREYIKQVNIQTINNVSGCGASGYQDFTNISTTLNVGNTYPVQLTPGFFNAGQHPERWLIWIDFNNDYDFDDPGEQVFNSGTIGNANTTNGSINIPSNAPTGTSRMRIKMIPTDVNTVTLDPCNPVPGPFFGPDQYGEAEDYAVSITNAPPTPTFLLTTSVNNLTVCAGTNGSFTANLTSIQGFNSPVTLTVTGGPAGSTVNILPNPVIPSGLATVTLSGLTAGMIGSYALNVTGVSGNVTRSTTVTLIVSSGPTGVPFAISPMDGASGISTTALLTWTAVADAGIYCIDLSTNPSFPAGTLITIQTSGTSGTVSGLQPGKVYYWRIQAKNICGSGTYSSTYAFQTGQILCDIGPCVFTYAAIDSLSVNTRSLDVDMSIAGTITDVNVKFNIAHTWVGDLSARLISPYNDNILLFDRPGVPASQYGCDGDNVDLTFDSQAALSVNALENQCNSAPYALSGTFQPFGSLDILNGKNAQGNWRLVVTDNEIGDGGGITKLCISFCLDAMIPSGSILINSPLTVSSGGSGTVDMFKLKMATTGTAIQGQFIVLSLPAHGSLRLNGVALGVGGIFTQADIINNIVVYNNNGDGATADNFHFDALDQNNNAWVHDGVFNINITGIPGAVLEVESAGAEELIREVFIGGNCLDVMNVVFSGGGGIGKFSNGLTNIGFENGIIMATGDINIAPGPNDQDGAGGGGAGGSDSDLAAISPGALYDLAVIEFDFIPTQTPLTFSYAFASEEYCEYVNTAFNDVFGFFITGPGIVGTQNLAVVPLTTTPITINTVNHMTNSGLYTPNTPAGLNNCENGGVSGTLPPQPVATSAATQGLQYDGFTKIMTAIAQVIPCSTYHIKLAIADGGDGVWDSAVFLKEGLLNGGGNASIDWLVNGQTGVDVVTEGCGSVGLLIDRLSSNASLPLPVSFTITGTATSGADYSPISATYVIPAGTDQITIPVNIINDLIPEGAETVILTLNNACSCLNPQEILTILDISTTPVPAIQNLTLCKNIPALPLTATGSNLLWYSTPTGGIGSPIAPTPNTSNVGITTYYVSQSPLGVGNCTESERAAITVTVTAPSVSVSSTGSCGNSGTATATASGSNAPYSYHWSNNQTSQTAINLAPGNYVVTVTDGNGCTTTALATINLSATPVAAVTNTVSPSCNGLSNGSATVSASGGVSPYTYLWSNGQTGATATNLAAGNNFVTVTGNNGCATTTALVLNNPPALQIATNVSGNVITVQASGGTGFLNYSINGINFQPGNQFTNLTCGNYTVTVRDANGCTATSQATVNILAGSFQTTAILCFGGSTTISMTASCGLPPYLYKLGTGQFQSSNTFSGITPGTYTASIKDASNATIVLGPIVVNGPPQFNATATVICNDATLAFSGGTPPYISDPASVDLKNLSNGTYQVTSTDGNGCTTTSTFTINVPPLAVSFTTDSVKCFGGNTGSITANGAGGCPSYSYSLNGSNFQTSGIFPNLSSTTYSLTVKDDDGNLSSSVFVTVFQPALLGLSAVVSGHTITASPNGGTFPYLYRLNGGTAQSSGIFSNLSPGTYTVVCTDANGCTASKMNLIVITSTVEPSEAWGLSISPNPSTGLYMLTLQNAPDVLHAEVFDVTGRLLQSLSLQPVGGQLTTTLDLQGLPQGTYLLRLSDGKNWGGVRLSKVD